MSPSGHVDRDGFLPKGVDPSPGLGRGVTPEAMIEALREIGRSLEKQCPQGGGNCRLVIPHSIKKGHGGEGCFPVRSMRRGSTRMQAARCSGGGKDFLGNEKVSLQSAEEKLKGCEEGGSTRKVSTRMPAVRY